MPGSLSRSFPMLRIHLSKRAKGTQETGQNFEHWKSSQPLRHPRIINHPCQHHWRNSDWQVCQIKRMHVDWGREMKLGHRLPHVDDISRMLHLKFLWRLSGTKWTPDCVTQPIKLKLGDWRLESTRDLVKVTRRLSWTLAHEVIEVSGRQDIKSKKLRHGHHPQLRQQLFQLNQVRKLERNPKNTGMRDESRWKGNFGNYLPLRRR